MKTTEISPDPYNILSFIKTIYPQHVADIDKQGETITVVPKKLPNFLYKNLELKLQTRYANAEFKSRKDGELYKIRVAKGGRGSIHIFTGQKSKLDITRKPGLIYELYFQSMLLDGITITKDRRKLLSKDVSNYILNSIPYMNFSIVVAENNNKKVGIGNIKSSDLVGGKNQKPDVVIYRNSGNPIRISLKQSNFFHWGGADTFNPRFSPRAKKLLSDAIEKGVVNLNTENNIIFPRGVSGIRFPATRDETKYYIFGEGTNTVEYVMINARLNYYDEFTNITYMTADKIYKKGVESDIDQLLNDTFLLISKNYIKPDRKSSDEKISGPTSMIPYKGIRVSFVNRSHAYDPRNNYVDG